MTEKVRISLATIDERLKNHIETDTQAHADINVRLTNLENRFQTLKDNELKHLKRMGLNRKEKTAIIIGILGFAGNIVQFLIMHFWGKI